MIAIQYYQTGGPTVEWVVKVTPTELRLLEEEFDFYSAWQENILIKGLAPRDSYDLKPFSSRKRLFLSDVFSDIGSSPYDEAAVDDGLSIFHEKETVQEFLDVGGLSEPS